MILSALLDFMNDFTSPWCMYGITINGTDSSGTIQTPMRLRILGWSNLLAILHSLIKSSAVHDEKSTDKEENESNSIYGVTHV